MFCTQCGQNSDAGNVFCSECGARLAPPEPSSKHLLTSGTLILVIAMAVLVGGALYALSFIFGSSGDLTRGRAERLIEASPKFSQGRITMPLNKNGFEKGVQQDMWDSTGRLTARGQRDFTEIGLWGSAKLAKPIEAELEVNGITDVPLMQGVKEAQFVWRYKKVPPQVKRVIGEGGTGAAYFRKYDDGWRAEDISINYSKEPTRLNPEEIAQEQQEIAAIEDERRIRLEKERQEKERLEALLQKSKTRTKNLGYFVFSWPRGYATRYVKMTISDVDMVEEVEDRAAYTGSTSWTNSVWFGNILKIEDNQYNRQDDPYGPRNFYAMYAQIRSPYVGTAYYQVYSKDQTEIKKVSAILSQAVADWREHNSEVVQKNLR